MKKKAIGKKPSRRDGGFYTKEGLERLRAGGKKGKETSEKHLMEMFGPRHRVYWPLTRQAGLLMKSIRGFVAKFRLLNGAIERELDRKEKKGQVKGGRNYNG